MSEFNTNLWAPWRMEYIRSFGVQKDSSSCFLCSYWAAPQSDASNHVIWRSPAIFVLLNRFPYTNGHLLVATGAHKSSFDDLTDAEICALGRGIRDGVSLLTQAIGPQGFNIGYNLGPCAGAGLPGHLHAHIVPRWAGDTNFMAVLDNVRIIPDALDSLAGQLRARAAECGLRQA